MSNLYSKHVLILLFFISCLTTKAMALDDNRGETAYKKGLNWILKHPQRIEDNIILYGNELLFYYLMIEESKSEKERKFFSKVFLRSLKQSDGFNFNKPASFLETDIYGLILGLRKWSGKWDKRHDETDSKLLYIINEDINKNINKYIMHNPLELTFIEYVSRKYNIKIIGLPKLRYSWWEFLGVMDGITNRSSSAAAVSFYDILVGYHVTHVIFIDSDYGLRHLSQKSYTREFQYFINNIDRFILNKNTDLVSEFLLCLKILGCTNTKVLDKVVNHIINSQNDDGSWDDSHASKKHTTIASLLALRHDR